MSSLIVLHENELDLTSAQTTIESAYKKYVKSRPAASSDSHRRIKQLNLNNCAVHPVFRANGYEYHRYLFLDQIRNYRPNGTIFEICGKNKSPEYLMMKKNRLADKHKIELYRQWHDSEAKASTNQTIIPSRGKLQQSPEVQTEKLWHFGNKVQLDLTGDSEEAMNSSHVKKKWDRKKKKKIVGVENPRKGKNKTKSGAWIPSTYKSDRYAQWKEKTKTGANYDDDDDRDEGSAPQDANGSRRTGRNTTRRKS
ncbi:hypothetical protein HUJ04_011908 [Dendroctonus ponderosae]|nr:hypothetical protein HUJ04_011908 [Dendroctonus ponderosae]